MIKDTIKVEYDYEGHHFEILVKPKEAQKFKSGELKDISSALFVVDIFKDVSSAERVSEDLLKECFDTTDPLKAAEKILREGKMSLTTEQVRQMKEDKTKQIVHLIARRAMNPQTNAPHPPQRIENAISESKVNIDPLKPVEEQLNRVVDAIKSKIPLSFDNKVIVIKIPHEYSGKAYSVVKGFANIKKEEWTSSYLFVKLELPAGAEPELLDKLNAITHGNIEVKQP